MQHNHIHAAVFQFKQDIILANNACFHYRNLFFDFFRIFAGHTSCQFFQLPQIFFCIAGFFQYYNFRL